MIIQNKSSLLANILTFISFLYAYSQDVTPLSQNEIGVVIDSVVSKLKEGYVFPEVADKMSNSITKKYQNGAYNTLTDPDIFANTLTEDLQAISNDKHLRVNFAPARIEEQAQVVTPQDSIAHLERRIQRMKRNNFGFKEVKIMSGNIGYLDLRGFSDVTYGGETAVASMNFLSNSDAIIIDLRNNGGGSPRMIQLISSYLFTSDPVHLNNFYWRPTNTNSQTWTLPHVSGKRSPDTPVYVLTSASTFSAAEEFSYNLKNLERATLIGETTGGGAHPGGPVIATNRFMIWIPNGRAINPITNTNWEGKGVSPHIEVPSKDALNMAYTMALEELIEKNENKDMLPFYEWTLTELKAKANPTSVPGKIMKTYVGTYGPRSIHMENNSLYYQREGGTVYKLTPITENEFLLEGFHSFRVRFLSEGDKVVAIQGIYQNGRRDKNRKD